MTDLTKLYNIADKNDILIVDLRIHNDTVGAMSQCYDNKNYIIGIDEKKIDGQADLKVKLAHELGHCKTGSFYNRYSKLDVIGKHERRADTWAANKLIPVSKIKKAFQEGDTEAWQLAERFEVTQQFVERAIQIYKDKGLL